MSKKTRGLFDYEYQLELINKHQPPLQKLNAVIDWEMFRTPIEEALHVEPKAPGGRPPFDRLMMFKIIILQRYYNLSDEQTEFQIKDRLSFMQFLGLQIGDKIPDEKTVWHFKEQLKKHKLSKKLFDLFTAQLINNGVVARAGSMVDASFVNVPGQRNTREENDTIKQGNIPESFENNPAKLSQKDTDARWMTKNKERHFGYKNHINADAATKLITKFVTSSASLHDSQKLEELVSQHDNRLFADSAYRSDKIESYLWLKKCKSFIHEKAYRSRPLTHAQERSNSIKSKIRVKVEHVFGYMTNSMNNGLDLKAIGKERIESTIGLLNLTYNLFRYEQLVRLQKVKKI
ncbi:transposase, IS4 family [Epsilonproteobacteria bacterium SCGC AD-311-C15]|jgi:transposase, IS5 family|nr:transposase, IS4 family [Epsilonproteobacteria bacterium SCGC AD-311-C15]